MGLYDYLRCEAPLPAEYEDMQTHTFQTKGFHRMLDTYTICAGGTVTWAAGGTFQKEYRCPVDLADLYGDIFFYDFRVSNDWNSGLITFRARFTHGVLEEITVVDARPPAKKGDTCEN